MKSEDELNSEWRALEERRCFEYLNKRCSYCNKSIAEVTECKCWSQHRDSVLALDERHRRNSEDIKKTLLVKYPDIFKNKNSQ